MLGESSESIFGSSLLVREKWAPLLFIIPVNQAKKLVPPNLSALIEVELNKLFFDLVELECLGSTASPILRVTISDPAGHVGFAQCTQATKQLRQLEKLDDYSVEVWSPGIGRELKTDRDFQLFLGKQVEVTGSQTAQGKLFSHERTEGAAVSIIVEENGEQKSISLQAEDKVLLAQEIAPKETQISEITIGD